MSQARADRRKNRDLDIVLFGATGFTGALVAEYIVGLNAAGLRIALAGRNLSKLESLRSRLARDVRSEASEIPLLQADSSDLKALREVAARTKVVCTTVGPFAKLGSTLVEACVKERTDYCDITGEVHWIRKMIEAHHAEASETETRIVHCCGFDSIPSDLGTLMVQTFAKERFSAPCAEVALQVQRVKGGFSGGTIASMVGLMEELARDPSLRKVLGQPYALNPEGLREGPDDDRGSMRLRRAPEGDGWLAPFIMAAINTRIVRRSNALLDFPYGREFRYQESMMFPAGPRGALLATAFTAGLGGFMAALSMPALRQLLRTRVLPKQGEGPTKEEREQGYFKIRLVGKGEGPRGSFRVEGRVVGTRDPGYGETAKMLGETARLLADDEPSAQEGLAGGVLTPATALGMPLVTRLSKAGMTFEVIEK